MMLSVVFEVQFSVFLNIRAGFTQSLIVCDPLRDLALLYLGMESFIKFPFNAPFSKIKPKNGTRKVYDSNPASMTFKSL